MFLSDKISPLDFLNDLMIYLEDFDFDDLDGDGESITVIKSNKTYLINYHGTTKQIWVSSPLTWAHHFHVVDDVWVSTRGPMLLSELINNELVKP
jgi:frataxin-like iron-binding protein CyaY